MSAEAMGWVRWSCASSRSAAGQLAQPSEVKSSTRTGVVLGRMEWAAIAAEGALAVGLARPLAA